MINKKLIDFKTIDIDENSELDHSLFNQLSDLLKRIGKSEQKTSQIIELLKDDLSDQLESSKELVDNVRQEKNEVKRDIDALEKGLLEYFNILDGLQKAAEQLEDKVFLDAVNVAIRAKEQINAGLGIQIIPSDPGQIINPKYHYIVKSVVTKLDSQDSTINLTIEHGYRRGDRVLRLASVIANVYTEDEHG
jgi:molecular chaperone GrpE (heat shock protein)